MSNDENNDNQTSQNPVGENTIENSPTQINVAQVAHKTVIMPDDLVARVRDQLSETSMRALTDIEGNDDDGTMGLSAYQIRVAELTEDLMRTPEAVAISRLAYHHKVEHMIRAKHALETGLLRIAEDLIIQLPVTRISMTSSEIIHSRVAVRHDGAYKMEQLIQIIVYIRQRLARMRAEAESALIADNSYKTEIAGLQKDLETRQRVLEELRKVPPPPLLDNLSPYILSYLDKKGRRNYLGKSVNSFIRTRNLRDALRFPNPIAAGIALLELLRDISLHAFPNAYRLEIGSLHVINQPIATLDKNLQTDLLKARETAVKYEANLKDHLVVTKTPRNKKRRRRAKNHD
jgi:hypothetical protein